MMRLSYVHAVGVSYLCGSQISFEESMTQDNITNTPPKFNMEPENQPLEKEIPILETTIVRFHVKLWGV